MTSWKTTRQFTITLGDVTVASITSGAVSDGLILNDDSAVLTISNMLPRRKQTVDFTVQATVTLSAEVEGGFDVAYSSDAGHGRGDSTSRCRGVH